jgi:hypothetical protein
MAILNIRGATISGFLNIITSVSVAMYSLIKQSFNSNTPSNSGDRFGSAIAIEKTNTVFIGAFLSDAGGVLQSGSVFQFDYDTTWTQTQIINLGSNGQANSEFGGAIDVSNDWLVIAASAEDFDGLTNAGAVYIYKKNNNTWGSTYHTRLISPTPSADNYFGKSISIFGNTLIVGEYAGDSSISNSGVAHVYIWNGTSWILQQTLDAGANAATNANFGFTVSLDGDTAVVGSYLENSGAGALYIFQRSGTTWSQQVRLTPSVVIPNARFGYNVKLRGSRLVVGSPYPATSKGRVYYFKRIKNIWIQQAILTVDIVTNNPTIVDSLNNGSQLGTSVDIHPSQNVILAGAPTSFTNAGRVYVFEEIESGWTGAVTPILPEGGSSFNGYAVAFNGTNALSGERRTTGTGKFYYYVKQ